MKNPFTFLDKDYTEDLNLRMIICKSRGGGDFLRYVYGEEGEYLPRPLTLLNMTRSRQILGRKELRSWAGKVEASNSIFFFPVGKKVLILRLNYIILGFSKVSVISFTYAFFLQGCPTAGNPFTQCSLLRTSLGAQCYLY